MSDIRKPPRQSNFELLRIISMLLILGLHYYNFGVILPEGEGASFNHLFFRLVGFPGRIGVDLFVLIGGYFLVEQEFRSIKAFRIVLQCGLLTTLIELVYCCFGLATVKSALRCLLSVFTGAHWFVTAYFLLYLFSDALNVVAHRMSRKKLLALVLTLLTVRSILPTFLGWRMDNSSLLLFVTLYLIAAYIRLYDPEILKSRHILLAGVGLNLLCYAVSAVLVAFQILHPMCMVIADRLSEKDDLTMIASTVMIFAGFRQLDIGRSRLINSLGAATFGVFLIHMSPHTIHLILVDLLKTPEVYQTPWLVLHAPLSILGIFLVCAGLDILYRRLIQDPLMRWIGRHWDAWGAALRGFVRRLLPRKVLAGLQETAAPEKPGERAAETEKE